MFLLRRIGDWLQDVDWERVEKNINWDLVGVLLVFGYGFLTLYSIFIW